MEFRVLGPLEVVDGGPASAPSGVKERTILARLLLEPGRPVSADALLEAAWPERPDAAAGRSLQVRLAHLRAFLEPDRAKGAPPAVLVRDGAGYRLAVEPGQVDARRFEHLVAEAAALPPAAALDAYRRALELWRGPPFAEVAYADFAQPEIRRLEGLRARADEGRAQALAALGRHEEAVAELRRLAAAEPLREDLARELARSLYLAGRQVEALDALRSLGGALRELGLEPADETRALEHAVLVHDPDLTAGPPATSGSPPARALPAPASRFFGREAHLDHAAALLRDGVLVTVTGVGGAGKTRLAVELARRSAERFGDDRWWCELAPAGADADVPGAIADALGIDPGSAALERIAEHLAPRRGLLVLDNCEHVLEGAAAVAEALPARCPELRILATSRAPLGVDGEQVLRLAGLDLPAGRESPDAGDSPAVALFLDRAHAAGAVVVPATELAAVGELCRRLDGLPLAIELAAGRTRSMTTAEIAARHAERLTLLAVPGRRAATRHATLRAAIDWSYELLAAPQQRLYERLSVFARGATLDGATDVCAGDGVEPADVPALLDELVAHSMVTASGTSGGTLYGMLETLREYAGERLERRGERERLVDRHAGHYAARAERMGTAMWASVLPFIDELDDIRAALRRCLQADPGPTRAFTILVPLWGTAPARHAAEIAQLAEDALDRWPQDHPLRKRVLGTAATARLFSGDAAAARRLAEAAVALERPGGEPALMARRTLAHLAMYAEDRATALARTLDVSRLARAGGADLLACECDGFSVQLLHAVGEEDAAIALAARMLAEAERVHAPFMVCWARYVSGIAHLDRDRGEARRWFGESIALGREVGHHHMVRFSLRGTGVAALLDGDHDEAARRFLEALAHDEARSDAASQWTTLMAIGALLAERDRLEPAGDLLAAAASWPAAPFLVSLAGRARERLPAGTEPAPLDLAAAKALARAELAGAQEATKSGASRR